MAMPPRPEAPVSPNLIPMIDVMFLLLLFFMLSADMGVREFEKMSLPKAESAKPEGCEKGSKQLTVNVFHRYPRDMACGRHAAGHLCREETHWRVGARGRDFTDPAGMEGLLADAAATAPDASDPGRSRLKVTVRADRGSPYGLVQRTIHACAKVGVHKVRCATGFPQDAEK